MPVFVTDPRIEERLLAERQRIGADRYDEVWEGVYMMAPMPNIEHQEIVAGLVGALLQIVVGELQGKVFPGINVSDREEGWEQNYRCPDVAVYLASNRAKDCGTHWRGGPDFAVEIVSPHDRAREKLPFYAAVGTRELLIVDRDPWQLELCRLEAGKLSLLGRAAPEEGASLASAVLPASFALEASSGRPRIRIRAADGKRQWSA
jgi:Uma2 family endonuclease